MTARTITTAAELDALPVGSVVVEGDHTTPDPVGNGQFATIPGVFHRFPDGWYVVAGYGERAPEEILPATVLHDPSAPTVPVVSDAAVEAAAQALADDWNPDRDPVLTAMFRDYAATAVAAALPFLGAAPSVTREDVDLTAVIGDVWDDGNGVGLDGWTGPGRGAGEVDREAVHRRERAVRRALDAITRRTDR